MKRALCAFLLTVFLICLLSPVLTVPRSGVSRRDTYLCVWEDGGQTRESYASAFCDYSDCGGGGIFLERQGKRGKISLSEEANGILSALEGDTPLLHLLSLSTETLTRLEKAAIARKVENRLWYDGDWFCFDENGFCRTQIRTASELFLLAGNLPKNAFENTGTQKLLLGNAAAVSANDFLGCSVTEISAFAPYCYQGGGLYIQTAVGKRLIAAMPYVANLCIDAVAFEEGALSPCTRLRELSVPFVGNFADANAPSFRGEFSYLFGESGVVNSLERVSVTGGTIVDHAFFGCSSLKEINVCGVEAGKISPYAFAGLEGLRLLHSPKKDVRLNGTYTQTATPCGCTLFERSGG